jgi:hypothetical protein
LVELGVQCIGHFGRICWNRTHKHIHSSAQFHGILLLIIKALHVMNDNCMARAVANLQDYELGGGGGLRSGYIRPCL